MEIVPEKDIEKTHTITLNSEQKEASDKIITWLNSRDSFFTLGGAAGTGKSTLIGNVLEQWGGKAAVTAPTHKAKRIISEKSGLPGATIQALLGLRPDVNLDSYSIIKPQFFSKAIPQIICYPLVIVDEASMITRSIFDLIYKEALKYNTKILFTGDHYQLTPVKESESVVFITDQIANKYFLDKVMRQSDGNPLMKIYTDIREDIKSVEDRFDHSTVINEKGEGIVFIKIPTEFANIVQEGFRSEQYALDKNYCKVLCWTNDRVRKWNGFIRKSLYTNPKVLESGEVMMAYSSVQDNIINSSEYTISLLDTVEIDGIRVLHVSLEDIYDHTVVENYVVEPTRYNYSVFLRQFTEVLNYARKHKGYAWEKFYAFKNRFLLLTDIKDKLGNRIVNKDLDYGYALSIHKSQGSTYNTVFVDEVDINKNWNKEERNRLKYVAFSRPSNRAIVLT